MDQEKFDQHLMDYLFDELDEVTRAAMKRKIESDADCRELAAGLRATIEVAQLPLEEPEDDLEERIVAAAELAQKGEPWHKKALRSLSWAGSWAMRPQLAMAALLMLVIGSSVLLMRARPGSVAVTPSKDDPAEVAATPVDQVEPAEPESAAEEEAPAVEADEAEGQAMASAEPKAAAEDEKQAVPSYDEAKALYQTGRFGEAQVAFNDIAGAGGADAPTAALFEAKSVRAQSGCSAAVSYYHQVRARHGGTAVADDATYELADCLRQLGKTDEAKKYFALLADNEDYKERVAHELSQDGKTGTSGGSAVASKRRMAAKPKPAAPPPPPAAEPKAPAGSTGGKAKAAPDNAYDVQSF